MKFESVNDPSIVNKLYRPTKIQKSLMLMHQSESKVFRVILSDGEYTTIRSAQASWHNCIKKLGFHNMKARVFNGVLYIIKLEEDKSVQKDS